MLICLLHFYNTCTWLLWHWHLENHHEGLHPKGLGEFNPWNAPGPKRDFILSLGFALQRANSRMLRNADRRRRNARGCGLYSSGTRPSSSDDDY